MPWKWNSISIYIYIDEQERKTKTITVTIPPGVDNGDKMRVNGQGDAGKLGGRSGNLYIKIQVSSDDTFHRDGNNLHVEVPLSITQAVLGGKIQVPTIDGPIDINLKEGTQPGDKYVIRNKGVVKSNGFSKGDQVLHYTVKIPTYLLLYYLIFQKDK